MLTVDIRPENSQVLVDSPRSANTCLGPKVIVVYKHGGSGITRATDRTNVYPIGKAHMGLWMRSDRHSHAI